MRLIPGGARLVDWLRTALPGVGKLWIFSGHHELASILHALTRQRIPLDAALRCTVASLRDRNLARALRLAGVRAGRGAALGSSMAESIHFDPTLTSLVRWGESNDSLPDALQQACQHFEGELDLQATFLSRVLPPFLLVAVTGAIFCVVIGLMAPIVPLMRGLMWW